MKNSTLNLALFTALSCLTLAVPAFAASEVQEDKDAVNSDAKKLDEVNADIKRHDDELEAHRASKADAKAKGDTAKQAGDSVRIGADHTAIAAKRAERKIVRKKLEHDEHELHEDSAKTTN